MKQWILKCENIRWIKLPPNLSVYFVADYEVQKNLPLTLIMSLKKQIVPSYFYQILTFILSSQLSQSGSSHSGFLTKFHINSSWLYARCLPYMFYLPWYDYVNNIWRTITDMKLTAESSAPLHSYLPLTSNILHTPCSHKPTICVLLLM
jgi:hypothetical protein